MSSNFRNNYRSSSRGDSNRPYRGGNRGFSRPQTRRKQTENINISQFVSQAKQYTEDIYTAKHTFNDFEIAGPLKDNIALKGYVVPTPIQDQSIPSILEGRDLIGLANTGTGKTAAFLIPIINRIFRQRDNKALIIVPTRELAVQINDELRSLSAGLKVYSTLIIGGANMHRQIQELRRNPHIVVGTPGRIKDLVEQERIYLEDFNIVVLDEVDLMVDIGFINDVKYFIQLLPKDRQSLFFSATISPKIKTILDNFVNNPVSITIKRQDTSENVQQDVVIVKDKSKKLDQLHDLLIQDGFDKVLIFGRTKHEIDRLHKELLERGFRTGAIHGNKKQSQRQRILQSFKKDEIQILLATDVASRGLDISDVSHVINYDVPDTYADYIHRIGRTGRANKSGVALTFVEQTSQPRF